MPRIEELRLKDKMTSKMEMQISSSSNAAKARRKNAEQSTLELQDELDALDILVDKLSNEQAQLETGIVELEGWG
ncbi:hypothetical protein QQS21_005828 [Conoideocrella luteorostrata]|uniref:Uncharacterized protein n=1 Tax=Conoideocrella luteorostrata TaxID=1105319 RepID=A0AAJ0CRQ9_9HYPO|nr:hypothetical protein QQS21_005828 [Conoideocrella luteorostrata]